MFVPEFRTYTKDNSVVAYVFKNLDSKSPIAAQTVFFNVLTKKIITRFNHDGWSSKARVVFTPDQTKAAIANLTKGHFNIYLVDLLKGTSRLLIDTQLDPSSYYFTLDGKNIILQNDRGYSVTFDIMTGELKAPSTCIRPDKTKFYIEQLAFEHLPNTTAVIGKYKDQVVVCDMDSNFIYSYEGENLPYRSDKDNSTSRLLTMATVQSPTTKEKHFKFSVYDFDLAREILSHEYARSQEIVSADFLTDKKTLLVSTKKPGEEVFTVDFFDVVKGKLVATKELEMNKTYPVLNVFLEHSSDPTKFALYVMASDYSCCTVYLVDMKNNTPEFKRLNRSKESYAEFSPDATKFVIGPRGRVGYESYPVVFDTSTGEGKTLWCDNFGKFVGFYSNTDIACISTNNLNLIDLTAGTISYLDDGESLWGGGYDNSYHNLDRSILVYILKEKVIRFDLRNKRADSIQVKNEYPFELFSNDFSLLTVPLYEDKVIKLIRIY